ncbi:hypothetical protein RclHR1_08810004 [Rhizophagus clarus]|nr:hypothetical protein RclHR1_08810004 [Rhizophagus clarus]
MSTIIKFHTLLVFSNVINYLYSRLREDMIYQFDHKLVGCLPCNYYCNSVEKLNVIIIHDHNRRGYR